MSEFPRPEELLEGPGIPIPGVGYVQFVGSNGDALTIVNAARASMGEQSEVMDTRGYRLCNFLARMRHEAPFRQVTYSWRAAMSIQAAFQLRKSKVGVCYTTRLIPPPDGTLSYLRPVFREAPDNRKQGSKGPVDADTQEKAEAIHASACEFLLRRYRETGNPNFFPMDGIVTVEFCASLQAVEHLLRLREASDAQGELQLIAHAIRTYFDQEIAEELKKNGVDLTSLG